MLDGEYPFLLINHFCVFWHIPYLITYAYRNLHNYLVENYKAISSVILEFTLIIGVYVVL